MKRFALIVFISLTLLSVLSADTPKKFAVRSGKLYTGTGDIIERGVLIVDNGKIVDVLETDKAPEGYEVYDYRNFVMIPGLVDAHSHLGLIPYPKQRAKSDLNEIGVNMTPMVDIRDSLNYWEPTTFQLAVKAGVTTLMVLPGSFNVFGGSGAIMKTVGEDIEKRLLRKEGVVKMALGVNPKYGGKKFNRLPQTRMGVRHMMWKTFQEAQDYKRKWDDYHRDPESNEKPKLDLGKEPLRKALERKMPVHIHCARADDIITACDLAKDFGLDVSLGHVYEGYLVAEELAKRKIPVVTGPVLSGWMYGRTPETPVNLTGLLADAGVKVAIMTDAVWTCDLLLQACYAVKLGMDEREAMKAITINPAEIMKVEHRVGSLARGKDADFVILNGPPFEVTTQVMKVFVEGRNVFSID